MLDARPTTDSQRGNVSVLREGWGVSAGLKYSCGCCRIQKCHRHIWLVERSLFLFRHGGLMAITWIRRQSVTGAKLKQSRDTLVNTRLYLGQLQNEEMKRQRRSTTLNVFTCMISFHSYYLLHQKHFQVRVR